MPSLHVIIFLGVYAVLKGFCSFPSLQQCGSPNLVWHGCPTLWDPESVGLVMRRGDARTLDVFFFLPFQLCFSPPPWPPTVGICFANKAHLQYFSLSCHIWGRRGRRKNWRLEATLCFCLFFQFNLAFLLPAPITPLNLHSKQTQRRLPPLLVSKTTRQWISHDLVQGDCECRFLKDTWLPGVLWAGFCRLVNQIFSR